MVVWNRSKGIRLSTEPLYPHNKSLIEAKQYIHKKMCSLSRTRTAYEKYKPQQWLNVLVGEITIWIVVTKEIDHVLRQCYYSTLHKWIEIFINNGATLEQGILIYKGQLCELESRLLHQVNALLCISGQRFLNKESFERTPKKQ